MSSTFPPALLVALAASAGLLLGCEDKPRTQVVIGIATDLGAPKPLDSIDLLIERFLDSQNVYLPVNADETRSWALPGVPAVPFELPGSFGAYAESSSSPKIRITVQGRRAGQAFIQRQAVFHLVPERTIFMRFGITSRCWDNADCPAHLTCVEGRCRAPDVADPAALPDYDHAGQSELQFACDSGTAFAHTATKASLVMPGRGCPNPDDVCIEGTCYRAAVFGGNVSPSVPLEVRAQISDPTGAPIANAVVRLEDGPVSLLRDLRTGSPNAFAPPRTSPMGAPVDEMPGVFRILATSDALTQDLRLTVTAPGFAPQVVSIPFKAGVARYLVPVVMFPLMEQQLLPGGVATLPVIGGGRTATIQTGAAPTDGILRYALIDGRYRPGQAVRSDTRELLQSAAILYLEHVDKGELPAGTLVTLGASSTPPVTGATGQPSVFRLDLQGAWQRRPEAESTNPAEADVLRPPASGFWSIANHTTLAGCIRGRVVQPGGAACPGVHLRLFGPDGVSSFDSTGIDGDFCATAAQQDAAIAAIGATTRLVYVPTAGPGAQCGTPETCADVGTIVVDDPVDCLNPTPAIVGRAQAGQACQRDADCAPLASCHQGFCTPEGYARISAGWTVTSDFDLHVALPDGRVLSQNNREIEGIGRLSFEQCAQACTGPSHAESVVLTAKAPPGIYRVWVENFSSAAPGNADISVVVAGKPVPTATQTVAVGATPDPTAAAPRSPEVTFELPAPSAR